MSGSAVLIDDPLGRVDGCAYHFAWVSLVPLNVREGVEEENGR